ncbi:unnamed protein product, partial [Amoebophrya sp. A25]|eukprot:GSA25T00002374001.1
MAAKQESVEIKAAKDAFQTGDFRLAEELYTTEIQQAVAQDISDSTARPDLLHLSRALCRLKLRRPADAHEDVLAVTKSEDLHAFWRENVESVKQIGNGLLDGSSSSFASTSTGSAEEAEVSELVRNNALLLDKPTTSSTGLGPSSSISDARSEEDRRQFLQKAFYRRSACERALALH